MRDGKETFIQRRYSEVSLYLQVFIRSDRISSLSLFTVIQTCLALSLFFLTFHSETLRDPFNLPPKRLFVTTFVPSAWLDDAQIAERKAGLTTYLCDLLASKFKHSEVLAEFLSPEPKEYPCFFDMEDALPYVVFLCCQYHFLPNALVY